MLVLVKRMPATTVQVDGHRAKLVKSLVEYVLQEHMPKQAQAAVLLAQLGVGRRGPGLLIATIVMQEGTHHTRAPNMRATGARVAGSLVKVRHIASIVHQERTRGEGPAALGAQQGVGNHTMASGGALGVHGGGTLQGVPRVAQDAPRGSGHILGMETCGSARLATMVTSKMVQHGGVEDAQQASTHPIHIGAQQPAPHALKPNISLGQGGGGAGTVHTVGTTMARVLAGVMGVLLASGHGGAGRLVPTAPKASIHMAIGGGATVANLVAMQALLAKHIAATIVQQENTRTGPREMPNASLLQPDTMRTVHGHSSGMASVTGGAIGTESIAVIAGMALEPGVRPAHSRMQCGGGGRTGDAQPATLAIRFTMAGVAMAPQPMDTSA